MKASQVVFFLTFITIISCKNTNSDETPKGELILQDSTLYKDSNVVEVFVWVDKLRLRKTPDTKSDIIQDIDEGETLLFCRLRYS